MRILGLEFGGWSLKAVEMEARFRRLEVLELHEIRLPLQLMDPTAAYRQAYEQLLARLPSHPEKIVASMPAAQTALRFLQIPVKQRKKVEQSFRFELEDSVPFKLDDAIVEHHVNVLKTGSLVFAAIAPKRYVSSYLEWLKSVGVDPDWLTFEGMGLINVYLSAQAKKEKKKDATESAPHVGPTMLIDIGHIKTNVAIIHEGRLQLFRSVPWGGLALTQAIGTGLVLSPEEAEHKKIRDLRLDVDDVSENSEGEELLSSAVQALSVLVTDISHSMVAFRAQFKLEVAEIVLTGGTAKTRGIDDFLNKSFGVPVSFFKPFREISFAKKEVDTSQEMRFGEAVGRASVFSRNSELLFNFRQEELAKTTSLNEMGDFLKDPNILKLAKYTGILVLLLFIGIFALGSIAEQDATKSREEVRKVFADTFRGVPVKTQTQLINDPKELRKYIDKKNSEFAQKLNMLSKSHTSMVTLLRGISDSFPPDVQVDVNTVALDDRAMKVEGVLYNGDINKVLDSLKRVTSFSNITLERDGQRFTLKGEVVAGR